MEQYDCDATARAVALWSRWSDQQGYGTCSRLSRSPDPKHCRCEGEVVILADCKGAVFARFRVTVDGSLRCIYRQPSVIR